MALFTPFLGVATHRYSAVSRCGIEALGAVRDLRANEGILFLTSEGFPVHLTCEFAGDGGGGERAPRMHSGSCLIITYHVSVEM